jgi:iron complex outermembrane receptor protein
VRSIGSLPKPEVSEYTALDVRLGWHATEDLEISLAGFNLLDNRHPEFGSFPTRSEIGRSVYLKLQWAFP